MMFILCSIVGATVGEYRSDSQPATRKRPFGLYPIIGLLLLDALSVLADVRLFKPGLPTQSLPSFENLLWTDALGLVVAAVIIFLVVGLWFLKRWAWVATMILVGIGLAFGIWAYFQGAPTYVSLLINTLAVFYLNQRDVQRAFERRGSVEGPA
jgi:uncharacterized membrane protein (DUF2068 family)